MGESKEEKEVIQKKMSYKLNEKKNVYIKNK